MINILCIGDSLTWGYYYRGYKKYPYSNDLEKHLKEYYKIENIKLIEKGVNGERVVNNMEKRLKKLLKKNKYSYVILLGGLNDLVDIMTCEKNVKDIMISFENMYKLLDNSIYIIKFFHITIPYCKIDDRSECLEYKKVKEDINNKIITELKSNKRYIIDINNYEKYKINYLCLNNEERKTYWDDELHLNREGYKLLAEYISLSFKENIIQLEKFNFFNLIFKNCPNLSK